MTARTSLTTSSAPDRLRDSSPSAKLVAKTLEYEGRLTQSQLSDETMLPSRTVRYALTQLEERGVVTSRISFQDARQHIYSLDMSETEGEDEETSALSTDE